MPASIRTLSQLPSVLSANGIHKESLFEVAIPVEPTGTDGYRYANRKVAAKVLSQKFSDDLRRALASENGLTDGVNVSDLCAAVSAIQSDAVVLAGEKTFSDNPILASQDGTAVISNLLETNAVSYSTLKKYVSLNASPTIGPNYGFVTTLSSNDGSSRNLNLFAIAEDGSVLPTVPNFVFDQEAKSVVPNEYVFKIKPGEKQSNVWTAVESGIFTCYGWLDEVNNPTQSNETRWVALLGKNSGAGVWTILQVQPFVKNNYLSYVSFTFPVKCGMQLQVRTGFTVGSNSDKYFAVTNSLANHEANAFLGGVYTEFANGTSSEKIDYEQVSAYAKAADLSNYLTKKEEAECDLSTHEQLSALSDMIEDLSGQYNTDPAILSSIDELSSEMSCRVKFINPNSYAGDDPIVYSKIVFGNSTPGATCGVFKSGILQESHVNGDSTKYQCLSIDFSLNLSEPFSMKDYYRPPTVTEDVDGKTGFVERAYFVNGITPGKVASDGKYFYYKVSQDSTVLIKFSLDAMSRPTIVRGWMLYDLDRGYNEVKALPILEKVEASTYNGYPSETVSMPFKAGTILMFGIYARERIPGLKYYEEMLQTPVIANDGGIYPRYLKSLRESRDALQYTYDNYTDADYNPVSRTAYLIYADGSNIGNITAPTATNTKYDANTFICGGVCYIYELP